MSPRFRQVLRSEGEPRPVPADGGPGAEPVRLGPGLLVLALLLTVLGALPARAQGELTLPEAAAEAVARHPDLRAAQARVGAAEARADATRAAFYPTLDANVGSTYSEASGTRTSGLTVTRPGGTTNYSIGFQARQTVFDFGRRRSEARAADRTVQAAEDDWQGTLQDLLLTVSESWFSVLRAQRGVTIQQDNVRNAQARLREAQGFYEAGTRARVEVTRAEADLATARVSLIQAENAERQARVALGTAMGRPQPVEGALAMADLADPGWDAEEAFRVAEEVRPDVLAARDRLDAARARVAVAVADFRPTISASGQYNFSDDVFPPEEHSWNLGMNIAMPILHYPTLQAAVAEAEANLAEQEARLESLLLQVRREVAEQVLNVRAAREQIEAATVGLRSAQENFDLASERYRVGVGSSLEVSEAQRLLVQAQSTLAQARFDLYLALARLYRQTGTLTAAILGE